MERDALIGWILIGCALGFITYITFWSRRMIERIYRKSPRSAREILKDINNG